MSGIVQAKLIGGFGNQLHQYAAVRKYAESVDAKLEVPSWSGAEIFGLVDPPWSCDLPEFNDGSSGHGPTVESGQTNIRLVGYFQTQRWVETLRRSELKLWFRTDTKLFDLCQFHDGAVYTAAHVRQGDYLGHPLYANVPEIAYERAVADHGLPADSFVWVRQNQPRRVVEISDRISFLPDFVTLVRSTVLLRANSTFSWWAATLSEADVYAPLVEDQVGECVARFVKGNWPRCADTQRVGVRIDDLHLQ